MEKTLPTTAEQCRWLIEAPTDLEAAVIGELIRFERVVATARAGRFVEFGDIDLDGDSFLSIFRVLTTYCIEAWDTKDYRQICLVERQVSRPSGQRAEYFPART